MTQAANGANERVKRTRRADPRSEPERSERLARSPAAPTLQPKAVAVSRQERRRTRQAATAADHHPCPDPPHGPARHPPHVATPADSGGDTLAIGWNSWPYASALERRATRKPAPPSRRAARTRARRRVYAERHLPGAAMGARGWPAGRPDGPAQTERRLTATPTQEAAASRHEPKRAIKPRYTTHPRADNRTARAPTDARPLSPARPTTQPSPSPRAHPPAPPT